MLQKVEMLLLLLYTAPPVQSRPATIIGSTRLQKLMFLAPRESEELGTLCPTPYRFIAYDYGPYSNSLERDVEQMASQGIIQCPGLLARPQRVEDLSFEYLTGHLRRPSPNSLITLTEEGVRLVKGILRRLREDGLDPELILGEFGRLHGRFTGLNLDDLLRFVYEKYPPFAENTRRPDLRPGHYADDADDGEDGDEP